MATKHLYHVEDVGATLLYAIQTNHPLLATQTFQELGDSGESDLRFRLLTLAWILSPPTHPHQGDRAAAVAAMDARALLASLLGSPYDLPALPEPIELAPPPSPTDAPAVPPAWRITPIGWTPQQTGVLWNVVSGMLRRKGWKRVAHLTRPLLTGNVRAAVSLLTALGVAPSIAELLETTVFAPLATRILEHALASLVATPGTTAPLNISKISKDAARTARALSLPIEALSQWRRPSRPVSDLIGSPVWVTDEDATQYWRSLCAAHGVVRQGDDLVCNQEEEAFYVTGFPNDIPDEWSTEERSKSHGLLAPLVPNPWVPAFLLCWS